MSSSHGPAKQKYDLLVNENDDDDDDDLLPPLPPASQCMTILSTVIACAAYMFIGPSLILLNKYILDTLHFPFPIFLSCLGVICSALSARIAIALGFVTVEKKEAVAGKLWFVFLFM